MIVSNKYAIRLHGMMKKVGAPFVEEFSMNVSFGSSFLGFVLGLVSVLALEAILIVYAFHRLGKKSRKHAFACQFQQPFDTHQSLPSAYRKQGVLWILEPEKVPKISAVADLTKKSDILEVSPVRKLAKIQDHMLILTEADGSLSKIMLKGCQIVAVSATSLPSRKWAKRYSIKLESKTGVLYRNSKVLYVYAETPWEKESWCRALRLASLDDMENLLWFSKLNEDFRIYLKSLMEGYPSFTKPSLGYQCGFFGRANRQDDHRSKAHRFWKKISRKPYNYDERRMPDRFYAGQDPISVSTIKRTAMSGKVPNGFVDDTASVCSSASTFSRSSGYVSDSSDAETVDRFVSDEGTLCWNLLVSRLFFDVQNNADIKSSLKARIQRTLSNMRTPSYIGEITCTDVDPGSLPPYIHAMRAVSTDMDDLGSLEMDIDYSGGLIVYIEARLDVGELDLPSGTTEPNIDSSSVGDESTDLLEGFKQFQEQMKPSDGTACLKDQKSAGKHKNSKTGVSTWKTMLNSVAKHVSQVPLALAIRVVTLKGTLQLHIKPPPTDQLWFGFTSMPDIQFELESSVGEYKIANGHVASFFINRFKASIREALVLPNCESASISWMLAEKEDWVPRSTAPFIFLNREPPSVVSTCTTEVSNPQSSEQNSSEPKQEIMQMKQNNVDSGKPPISDSIRRPPRSSTMKRSLSDGSACFYDIATPSSERKDETEGCNVQRETPECQSFSRYVSYREQRNSSEDGEVKPKKMGRKARMLDLGKRMGEKLGEKKRHLFGEKSRPFVENMRGP